MTDNIITINFRAHKPLRIGPKSESSGRWILKLLNNLVVSGLNFVLPVRIKTIRES